MDERVIVCFGDSNTHGSPPWTGEPRPRYGPDVRWPGVLAAVLGPSWRGVEGGLPGRATVDPHPPRGGPPFRVPPPPMVVRAPPPPAPPVLILGPHHPK